MFYNLFSLCLFSALVLPLAASPLNLEGQPPTDLFLTQSLPIEWYGNKPPEGCDPADPSTCRNEDSRDGSSRDKPNRFDAR